MEDFRSDRFALVVSDVTAGEIAMAPKVVRTVFSELLEIADSLPVTEEARRYYEHISRTIFWEGGFATICCM